MACKGCGKRKAKFKKAIKEAKMSDKLKEFEESKKIDKSTEHFKNVCPHGVQDGFVCKGCDKVISIPEDAVIKPEDSEKEE